MNIALDRDTLYYPYIHIRDENWLKATLLCFPQVRRMVPTDFHLNDLPEIQIFRNIEGLRGEPLLKEEPTDTPAIDAAQNRLRKKLEASEEFLLHRYSREKTIEEYGKTGNFQVYRGKMYDLLSFLEEIDLAWHEREIRGMSAWEWFGMHPKLGEAVMSVMAIAVARDKGLDIVTNSGYVHHALASLEEDAMINNLLETHEKPILLSQEDRAR